MHSLSVFVLACLAVFASARPSGHGVVVVGPAGVVTGHGAVGLIGHGLLGDGLLDDGLLIDGLHSNVVHGNGATLIGASAGHSVVHGAVADGLGLGLGLGDGIIVDSGLGLGLGLGHGHGVVVAGPPTVPAKIIGPGRTGSVVADGLWGPTHAHGHGLVHGHHW